MKTFKHNLFLCLVLIVSSIAILSCKSDDDGGGGGAAAGVIEAKVDGQSVTTLEMVSFASNVQGNLMIQGNTGGTSSKAFAITIIGFNGVGTYPIGGGANIMNSASYSEITVDLNNPMNSITKIWQAPYNDAQVGEINVSEVNDTGVKGTFHFKAQRVEDGTLKDITNGTFDVKFQQSN